ncbi:hypothetical protein W59_21648 [Rhodococcus opacus RKJ300 = JCM 13270]|uniref:Uncharacterized protein n=1 Tax=Rhodococcus opacus RKJ300 = JCM 13270 TaxID=1165867 RepID=I0WN74_RHOOP|nr:hypothetical protein [Rhodococcus opacus]EID77840.1 hypothetical protein W59_21648 [Rhodococcus opacus RKJ300 = JCM 13270]
MRTTASALGEELARIGLTVPTDRLEALLTDRVAAVAEQMHITERTARRYFDPHALRTLARELALRIKEEAPGVDLLTLPRTIAVPCPPSVRQSPPSSKSPPPPVPTPVPTSRRSRTPSTSCTTAAHSHQASPRTYAPTCGGTERRRRPGYGH